MAEKRMVSKVISISKKFNIKLNDHFSRLLYILLIPHSDDFGRLSGDPYDLKALVLPIMADVTPELVESALIKLHNVELIQWYEIKGEKYIQIINFDDHQQGLHKRTKSKFPDAPGHSGKFPEIPSEGRKEENEEKETELKRKEGTEEKERTAHAPDNGHKERLRILCNQMSISGFTLFTLETVYSYIGMADIEVIEAAIKKSERKPHSYLTNTLEGMIMRDKITRVEQLFPARSDKYEEHGRRAEGIRPGSDSATSSSSSITGGQLGWIGKNNVIPLQGVQG